MSAKYGTAYPAVLLETGINDFRVDLWGDQDDGEIVGSWRRVPISRAAAVPLWQFGMQEFRAKK